MGICKKCNGEGFTSKEVKGRGLINITCSHCMGGREIVKCPVCGEVFFEEEQLKKHYQWMEDPNIEKLVEEIEDLEKRQIESERILEWAKDHLLKQQALKVIY